MLPRKPLPQPEKYAEQREALKNTMPGTTK
jgi:hypothetical protein